MLDLKIGCGSGFKKAMPVLKPALFRPPRAGSETEFEPHLMV
jgi:hypothetical protein